MIKKKFLIFSAMSLILASLAGCKSGSQDKWELTNEDIQSAITLAAPQYQIDYENNTIRYVFHLGEEGLINKELTNEDIIISDKNKFTLDDVEGKFYKSEAILSARVKTQKSLLGKSGNNQSTLEIVTDYNPNTDPMLIIDKNTNVFGKNIICQSFDLNNQALNMDINDYSSKIIKQNYTTEVTGMINFASSIAMIIIGVGGENPAVIAGGITSLFNTCFATFGTSVSNQELLKEIYVIQAQLKEVIGKLDSIEKALDELKVITNCGFDKAYLLQIEGNWNNFISSYFDPCNRNTNDFSNTLASYLASYIKGEKDLSVHYEAGSDAYYLIAPFRDNYENPDLDVKWRATSFPETSKYLKNGALTDGFVDGFIADLAANAPTNIKGKSQKALGVDAYNTIVNEFAYNQYYSDDIESSKYQKALATFNAAMDFMDHVSGNYVGGQSILNDAYKRLTLMYNFGKEVKPIWTNFLATMKCFVTYFAQFAQTAALAAKIPTKQLDQKVYEASDKIADLYYESEDMPDNYSFVVGAPLGTKIAKTYATTSASGKPNHPTVTEGFVHRYLNYYGYKDTDYVEQYLDFSNFNVLSNSDVIIMSNRYMGIKETDNPNEKFVNYLRTNGCMDSYTNYCPQQEGYLANMSYGFLTNMVIRDMDNYDDVKCVWRSNGDYFNVGDYYNYQMNKGKIESQYWSNGKVAAGTMVNAYNGQNTYEENLAGYCCYWESHILWSNDEVWGFTLKRDVTHYWFLYVDIA